MVPGEYRLKNEPIIANPNRRVIAIDVANASDRPVQVGSHFHFFEVNRALQFDRQLTFGMRLNIPAGTAARFEPGDSKRVELTELAGARSVYGLNGLTEGSTTTDSNKSASLARAKQRKFLRAE